MRKLGIIGGMSWASTELYYRQINQIVRKAKGGVTSAPLLIESLDYGLVADCQERGDWACAGGWVIDSGKRLQDAGAGAIVLATNALHVIYDDLAAALDVPVINIVDVTAEAMKADGVRKAALIGTKHVMTGTFYRQRLVSHGIGLTLADPEHAAAIDRIFYDELALGIVNKASERELKSMLTDIAKQEVDAAILACTELVMLTDPKANVLPIYDTTDIHARAAAAWILGDG